MLLIPFFSALAWNPRDQEHELFPPNDITFVEDTVCPGESAILIFHAGSNSIVQWMDQGKVVHMGDTLHTPPLQSTKTYKVSYKTRKKSDEKVTFLKATVINPESYRIVTNPSEIETPKQEVEFSVKSADSIRNYKWNFGERGMDTLAHPRRNFRKAGRYDLGVEIRTGHGCVFKLKKNVEVKQPPHLDFPSAFSPNGDGFNDSLRIGHYDLKSFILKIYDRKGNLIFETENPDFVWDGVDIYGEETPEGVYSCQVKATTNEEHALTKKLTLTLIR